MESVEKGSEILQAKWNPRKGGFRAAMFIFWMSALENVGFIANLSSLVLYFTGVMHYDLRDAATTMTNFAGATFLLTLVGGFISDTYVTRHNTVLMFGVLEIVGYILLILQAHYKALHPDDGCIECKLEGGNRDLFYFSLSLFALGFGGIRGALPSLGADQFDRNNHKERKQLASFFNWYLLSITLGASFGVTIIVWISTVKGSWDTCFFVSMLLAIAGFGFVAVGRPFYRVQVPGESPILSIFQVVVVAIRNRKRSLPQMVEDLYKVDEKVAVEERITHSNQFSFLDKAAILSEGMSPKAWEICTVTQVEEVKILMRMLPILGSTVLMNTCLAQLQTFSVQQGNIMDTKLGSFTVPPASIPVIPLVFMSILIPVYEFLFVPVARRITGNPNGITHLQRVGVGLVLSIASMSAAALVELKRRNAFNNRLDRINLFWLAFQFGIFGIADLFTFVGLAEFFYTEAPVGMRSLSTSFTFLTLSFGFFLSSALVQIVETVTAKRKEDGEGWMYGVDLNKNRLDLFYWLLAILNCVNFGIYVVCAKWYKYRTVERAIVREREDESSMAAESEVKGRLEISRVDYHAETEKSTDQLLS